jgi:4-hydroxy-4-methyl-2-oxoglutarate aldolase
MMSREEVLKDYEQYKAAGRVWGQVSVDCIRKINFPRHDAGLVKRYMALEDMSTTISDLLDEHGIRGAVAGSYIKPLLPGRRMVGTAVTVRSIPERKSVGQCRQDKEPVRMSTREIFHLGESGDVLVVDFGGNVAFSNFGGQSARAGKSRGFAGALVHGAVRDLPSLESNGFPVWAAGVTPMTGKYRMQAIEINGPVTLHDVMVDAGDLIVADDNGICVVPAGLADVIILDAESVGVEEQKMQRLIDGGASLDQMLPHYRSRYR